MIKLKDIIAEIKKGTKLPVLPISRKEEYEAFEVIKRVLVPDWIKKINDYYKGEILTLDRVNQLLQKEKVYKRQGQIAAIRYSTNAQGVMDMWFLIKRNRKGKLVILNMHGESWYIDGTRGF